jgi:hypothetical protein
MDINMPAKVIPGGSPGTSGASVPWLRIASACGVVAVLAVAAPILWAAVQAGASLFALSVILFVGWLALRALPQLGKRLEMRMLRAQLAAAREQPLDELLHQLMKRAEQIEVFRRAVGKSAAQVEALRGMIERRRLECPGVDADAQVTLLQKMRLLHARQVERLGEAERRLSQHKRQVAQRSFEWRFVQAGEELMQTLQAGDRDTLLDEILTEEASSRVHASLDELFGASELELQGPSAGRAEVLVPPQAALKERS